MQLIRTNQILRFLCDLSILLRRQKLRADRRTQYIQQNIRKLFLATGICIIAHQMAHQHLRNRAVDTVHRHMIAVVGRPAKRQLRHIAGTDDKTADLIGKVHQNQRSLACL